jgi:hypothetical protein
MKSKIGLLAVVIFSGLVLSACTNKSISNTSTNNSQQNQTESKPSGTPDNKGPGQQMDLAAAATKLGVTEEALKSALGVTDESNTKTASTTPGAKPSGEPKKMDLAAAAKTLGVTEEALKEALGMNNMPSGQPQQGNEKPGESAPADQK